MGFERMQGVNVAQIAPQLLELAGMEDIAPPEPPPPSPVKQIARSPRKTRRNGASRWRPPPDRPSQDYTKEYDPPVGYCDNRPSRRAWTHQDSIDEYDDGQVERSGSSSSAIKKEQKDDDA